MAKLTDRTELTTPADGDLYVTTDVSDTTDAATGTDKKITWANIKATLKTYFDSLYPSGSGSSTGTNTGDQTITNSSDATSHTVTLSASGGSFQLIEGTNITLTTGGTGAAGTVTIAAPGGSGDVTKVGTPVDNQVGVWTGDGTLEGDAALTFDTSTDTLTTGTLSASTISGPTGITGGAGNMSVLAGTGASRTMSLRTTTAGGAVQENLLLSADGSSKFTNATDSASVQVLRLDGDRATPANNDEAYLSLYLSNVGGTQTEAARFATKLTTATGPSTDSAVILYGHSDGSVQEFARLTNDGVNNVISLDGGTTSISAPELNKLDGLTPTTVELNYVDGVTSAIQTQLDGKLALAGGTMSGNITLGENTSIALDPAGSADGKYSGITVAGTAGATLAFGDLCYLDPTDSRWELADANAAAAADGDARGVLGICVLAAGADGNATTMLLNGIVRADTAFPALTIGAPVYVSETAGDIVVTQPTTTDVVIRIVGVALTADEIFFNPDFTWTTHT